MSGLSTRMSVLHTPLNGATAALRRFGRSLPKRTSPVSNRFFADLRFAADASSDVSVPVPDSMCSRPTYLASSGICSGFRVERLISTSSVSVLVPGWLMLI